MLKTGMAKLTEKASPWYGRCWYSPYLGGTRFTTGTDREALKWKLNPVDATRKLARWRVRLSEMEFDVFHSAGTKHQATDALSRFPTTGEDGNLIDDALQACWSGPYRRMKGKDASNIKTSSTTTKTRPLPPRTRDYPPYAQLRNQQ